jgi:hypothetical protein
MLTQAPARIQSVTVVTSTFSLMPWQRPTFLPGLRTPQLAGGRAWPPEAGENVSCLVFARQDEVSFRLHHRQL